MKHGVGVRVLGSIVIVSLAAPQVSAADLVASAANAIRAEVAAQAQQQSSSYNAPLIAAGASITAVGAAVAIYGFSHETGVECTGSSYSINCDTKHNTALGIAGLLVALVGVGVLVAGARRISPQINFAPGRAAVLQRIEW